ncbi:AraC family transcriptional regulator [Solimonas sp. SE-A11]|uniref:helix-turn-helix transcriptional regulator n=1 Tax=Solimonas sp. SE-A11 TaxID=3054954 RepID=UPI00259CE4B2|nr:AraC family transcriptional regulator [Solimonas sp. SE-A11]MDM4771239.1 AraC family transcriptional regulator [Solimonas sp. SE-A11]
MTPLFRLFAWPQRLLLIGPGVGTDSHRHHAAQLCVGLEAPLRMRVDADQDWQQGEGFFVAADQPHQIDAGARPTAFLYLEADSDECRHYAQRQPGGIASLDTAACRPQLRELAASGRPEQAEAALATLLGQHQGLEAPPLDRRIAEALHWIGKHLDAPVRIADAARAVHLSESHFAHLFSEQVGVPLRRYVLWRRLREALARAMQGDSLTAAAHAAGFADSAHLSRAFREHFGVTPSFLFEQRARIAYTIFD